MRNLLENIIARRSRLSNSLAYLYCDQLEKSFPSVLIIVSLKVLRFLHISHTGRLINSSNLIIMYDITASS